LLGIELICEGLLSGVWPGTVCSEPAAGQIVSSHAGSAMLSVATAVFLEGLMASKRAKRTERRTWSKADVRELKAHSRSKSPAKKVAKAMKRTVGALRQKALSLGLPLGHRR